MSGAASPPTAVIGAGSWGTALAVHLARRGAAVRLWARDGRLAHDVADRRENARYLPGIPLPASVAVTAEAPVALVDASLVLIAVPSQFVEPVVSGLAAHVSARASLISATKGLEPGTGRRMSEVLTGRLPGRPVTVLSGPSFAREVAMGRPTALVAASADAAAAAHVQLALSSPTLRVYTNRDVVGVEVAGALKNVVAIAAGLSDALGLGENARAALVTRGLAEIERLGRALGASPATFAGLAGLGDLVLTCTGSQSRNHALGCAVGQGRDLAEVEAATPTVAEGVRTVRTALRLAREHGVSMPIAEAVAAVLFDRRPPAQALAALMAREPKPEDGRADLASDSIPASGRSAGA